MKAVKELIALLADASIIQTLTAATLAVLLLVPGVHVSGAHVAALLVAVGGLAKAIESKITVRRAQAPPKP